MTLTLIADAHPLLAALSLLLLYGAVVSIVEALHRAQRRRSDR